jgi:hypothetical protein
MVFIASDIKACYNEATGIRIALFKVGLNPTFLIIEIE